LRLHNLERRAIYPQILSHGRIRYIKLSDKICAIVIELDKIGKLIEKKNVAEMTATERWAFYLKCIDNPDYEKTFLELIERKEAFKVATNALTSISKNEQERYNLFARQKAENDYNHDMAIREEMGILKGIVKTAKRMLNNGKTVAEIAEDTGLTEQQIISLKEEK
jgi:predicted transposase/invertase (TIGR01784 family)